MLALDQLYFCFCVLVLILLPFDFSNRKTKSVTAKLNVVPYDKVAVEGRGIQFRCETSVHDKYIEWQHTPHNRSLVEKTVSKGTSVTRSCSDRFRIVSNRKGQYNLYISNVKKQDAGLFTCTEEEGFGERRSVQLIVLESSPRCSDNKVVVDKQCEQDNMTCTVKYFGDASKLHLEWSTNSKHVAIVNTRNYTIDGAITTLVELNSYTSLFDSDYVQCTVTFSQIPEHEQSYACRTNIIGLNFSATEVSVSISTSVNCSSHVPPTFDSCTGYRWEDGNNKTVVTNSIAKFNVSGIYRCMAHCLKSRTKCLLTIITVEVAGSTSNSVDNQSPHSKSTGMIVGVVLGFTVLCIISIIVVFIILRRKRQHRVVKKKEGPTYSHVAAEKHDDPAENRTRSQSLPAFETGENQEDAAGKIKTESQRLYSSETDENQNDAADEIDTPSQKSTRGR